jgi:predicted aspartyl protease
MGERLSFVFIFLAGVGAGWIGQTWYAAAQTESAVRVLAGNTPVAENELPSSTVRATDTAVGDAGSAGVASLTQDVVASDSAAQPQSSPVAGSGDGSGQLEQLLAERRYFDAMTLHQDKVRAGDRAAAQSKRTILKHLRDLLDSRNSNDFSDLIQNYLSLYYDDIEVLLLLAEFNQTNGSYLEAVDVYLLASTYAYTEVDQNNVNASFDAFIRTVDRQYTDQKNWLSLINLYSHVNASGLLTSPYQYRLAIAYLQNGDEFLATEHLRQLVDDSLVGEAAVLSLNNLGGNSTVAIPAQPAESALASSESVALEKRGNHYLVDLTLNRADRVSLLIDTGASITTLWSTAFNSLSTLGNAVEVERRAFRTAGGIVQGTVYSVSELTLGPYRLQDTHVAVLDFDAGDDSRDGFDGLLGMNVLGRFDFQIDQENSRLLLNRQ